MGAGDFEDQQFLPVTGGRDLIGRAARHRPSPCLLLPAMGWKRAATPLLDSWLETRQGLRPLVFSLFTPFLIRTSLYLFQSSLLTPNLLLFQLAQPWRQRGLGSVDACARRPPAPGFITIRHEQQVYIMDEATLCLGLAARWLKSLTAAASIANGSAVIIARCDQMRGIRSLRLWTSCQPAGFRL